MNAQKVKIAIIKIRYSDSICTTAAFAGVIAITANTSASPSPVFVDKVLCNNTLRSN